jgi:hypothetical protein
MNAPTRYMPRDFHGVTEWPAGQYMKFADHEAEVNRLKALLDDAEDLLHLAHARGFDDEVWIHAYKDYFERTKGDSSVADGA